jgi:predicted metal-dependent phosphoesterase TrpH
MKIDLHAHTTASDGKLTPTELIDLAIKRGIKAMAITDHNNVDGIEEAIEYSKNKDIEFVQGIEFSANPGDLDKEIHIVGLFMDYNHGEIKKLIEKQREFGMAASKRVIKKLNELDYKITFEECVSEKNRTTFGRPTIAQVLMRKYPEFKDSKQVFNELLGKEGKAFFKNEFASIEEIINVVHAGGGIVILAHPAYLDDADKVIGEFIKLGGDGLEAECPYESFGEEAPKLRDKFRKIAEENHLVISGGTDFHEKTDKTDLGDFGISDSEFSRMKEYRENSSKKRSTE